MSDDEFDVDFVSQASNKVKNNWKKKIDLDEQEVIYHSSRKQKRLTDSNSNVQSEGEADIDDCVEVIDDPSIELEVNITPPGSPQMTPRAVRGANRTKKTQQALDQLKTSNLRNLNEVSRENKRKNNTSINEGVLLLSDDEDLDNCFELKVRWKTDIVRVTVGIKERMGKVMDKVANEVGVAIGDVSLYLSEERNDQISRDDTVDGLGLSIVNVLYGRNRVITEGTNDTDKIELKLQTKDRRAQPVMLNIKPTDVLETVMESFSAQTGHARCKLKFFFDGEPLDGKLTAEDLELEGGECIDVHVSGQ